MKPMLWAKAPLATIAALLLAGGCASAYTVNVTASPAGATISQSDGSVVGQAPVTLNYNADPQFMSGGCFRAMGLTATWTSGARAQTDSVLRLCQQGHVYNVHLERPANVPGLQADLQVALMRERAKLEKERIAAEMAPETAKALGEALGALLAQ